MITAPCPKCNGTMEEETISDEGWMERRFRCPHSNCGYVSKWEQEIDDENERAPERELPANWFEDSSLETWFPLTAESLKQKDEELARLKQERDELAELLKKVLSFSVAWPCYCTDSEVCMPCETEKQARAALAKLEPEGGAK